MGSGGPQGLLVAVPPLPGNISDLDIGLAMFANDTMIKGAVNYSDNQRIIIKLVIA